MALHSQRTQQITANLTQKPGPPQVQHTPLPLPYTSIQLRACPKAARFQVLAGQSGSQHLRRARPSTTRPYIDMQLIYTQHYIMFLRIDRLESLPLWQLDPSSPATCTHNPFRTSHPTSTPLITLCITGTGTTLYRFPLLVYAPHLLPSKNCCWLILKYSKAL